MEEDKVLLKRKEVAEQYEGSNPLTKQRVLYCSPLCGNRNTFSTFKHSYYEGSFMIFMWLRMTKRGDDGMSSFYKEETLDLSLREFFFHSSRWGGSTRKGPPVLLCSAQYATMKRALPAPSFDRDFAFDTFRDWSLRFMQIFIPCFYFHSTFDRIIIFLCTNKCVLRSRILLEAVTMRPWTSSDQAGWRLSSTIHLHYSWIDSNI